MKVTLSHAGTKEEGIAQVNKLLEEHRKKIEEKAKNVDTRWDGNVLHFNFSAEGSAIAGTLTVKDRAYELYAKLPLALRLFEGTLERMIEAEARKMRL